MSDGAKLVIVATLFASVYIAVVCLLAKLIKSTGTKMESTTEMSWLPWYLSVVLAILWGVLFGIYGYHEYVAIYQSDYWENLYIVRVTITALAGVMGAFCCGYRRAIWRVLAGITSGILALGIANVYAIRELTLLG